MLNMSEDRLIKNAYSISEREKYTREDGNPGQVSYTYY